jgi:hypothetical protein
VLEQPVELTFAALKRRDMRVESGRVDIVQPSCASGLGDLLGDKSKAFDVVRDARRRTATRLEWNARPTALELTGTKAAGPRDLYRWIGGYELFSVDPDTLTVHTGKLVEKENRPTEAGKLLIEEVEELARSLGRVSLLPATMRGLDPAGFGDFGRIESAYPSDTLRLKFAPSGAGAGGVRKAGWYSAAETVAVFPQASIRRSLMPDPDEGLIASLFAGGKPDAIRLTITEWGDAMLPGWKIVEYERGAKGWGEYEKARKHFAMPIPENGSVRFSVARCRVATDQMEDEAFDVPAVRQLLQNLRLVPDPGQKETAVLSEKEALARRLSDPTYLSRVTVRLQAVRNVPSKAGSKEARIVATQDVVVDLMPRMHPILADTLAFIQYDTWEAGGLDKAHGRLYRRYAVSRDADPNITTDDFMTYVDQTPTERDPYGWGALRALGLAAGFRLFDTDTNDYVRFGQDKDLAQRIHEAFARALGRYEDGIRDRGQPFVDILTQTWGNMKLSWFDGGRRSSGSEEDFRKVENEMLAVVQVALRPHPDRLTAGTGDQLMGTTGETSPVVRYYALTSDRADIERPKWKIGVGPEADNLVRFDVLSVVSGIVAQKPVRLDKERREIELFEPWPAVPLPGLETEQRKVIAVIRAVPRQKLNQPERLLTVTLPRGREFFLEEIAQPIVLQGLEDETESTTERKADIAFGKFEDLSSEDWSDALFRPNFNRSNVVRTEIIRPHDALERVAYYVGRRFKPLELPVAPGASPSEEQTREAAARRRELAERIVRFWTRFVEHCAPAWGRPFNRSKPLLDEPDAIFFSLGTVADPGQSRRAPSDTGTLSMTIVDAERRGARRKLTVRPYGRYEAWANAVKTKTDPQADLDIGLRGAFDRLADINELGTTYFVDTTLPRTEPLEKPVILSSVTHAATDKEAGRLELVVAHGSDMVLAQANRRNAALLAPLDISVGFWREFGHREWLEVIETLHSDLKFAPLAQFGSLDQRLDVKQLVVTRHVAEQRLMSLRQRVPDAWLGSTMITATHLPYFFRTHALVHASAGIVVSEQATTTFEEGFYQLAWPFAAGGYSDRVDSGPHVYGVERNYVPAGPDPTNPKGPDLPAREDTILTFDIAAMRFIDCMLVEDANLWFGPNGEYWEAPLRRVAHLPEPGVSYRISIETPLTVIAAAGPHEEVLARVQEIDVIPSTPRRNTDRLYLLQQPGSRFRLDAVRHGIRAANFAAATFATNPEPRQHGFEWRVPVSVQLAQPTPILVRALTADLVGTLQAVLVDLPLPQPGLPPALDGLATVTVSWGKKPTATQWNAVLAALDAYADSPEAVELVKVAKNLGNNQSLGLQLGSQSAAADSVARALAGLGGDVTPEGIGALVVRRPPTNIQLGVFAKYRGDGTGPGATLERLVHALAQEQLFGVGRRPAVTASKGPEAPITRAFLRRIGA